MASSWNFTDGTLLCSQHPGQSTAWPARPPPAAYQLPPTLLPRRVCPSCKLLILASLKEFRDVQCSLYYSVVWMFFVLPCCNFYFHFNGSVAVHSTAMPPVLGFLLFCFNDNLIFGFFFPLWKSDSSFLSDVVPKCHGPKHPLQNESAPLMVAFDRPGRRLCHR